MVEQSQASERIGEVFWIFLALGLTSFGGPVAHLGYFRTAFVERRQWLSEQAYADLVALCQFLPGPASSQVGFALGLLRAGPWGAAMAWLAFTLPSAIILVLFAFGAAVLAFRAFCALFNAGQPLVEGRRGSRHLRSRHLICFLCRVSLKIA